MLKAQLSLSLLLGCLMVGPATLSAHAHALPPPRSVMTDATADDTVPRLSAETERRLLEKIGRLPVYTAHAAERTPFDWLIEPERSTAAVYRTPDGKGVVLANAMVARTLRVVPNLSTVSLINRMTGEEMLRAASSEGYVSLDGARWRLGGLAGQPERGYLDPAWLDAMEPLPQSFLVEDFEVREAKPTMEWARRRWALQTEDATGREVVFTLHGSGVQRNVTAELHFVIYDQVPALRKWLTLTNGGNEALTVDSFSLEQLAFAQPETRVSNHFDGERRAAVESVAGGQHAGAAGVERGELQRVLVGFGTRVDEEQLVVVIAADRTQTARQLPLKVVNHRVGIEAQRGGLPAEGFDVMGVAVADADDGMAAVEVEVLLPLVVPDVAAPALDDVDVKERINVV